jgi:hypothetical protein
VKARLSAPARLLRLERVRDLARSGYVEQVRGYYCQLGADLTDYPPAEVGVGNKVGHLRNFAQ